MTEKRRKGGEHEEKRIKGGKGETQREKEKREKEKENTKRRGGVIGGERSGSPTRTP